MIRTSLGQGRELIRPRKLLQDSVHGQQVAHDRSVGATIRMGRKPRKVPDQQREGPTIIFLADPTVLDKGVVHIPQQQRSGARSHSHATIIARRVL
jgi:hypothetical protein